MYPLRGLLFFYLKSMKGSSLPRAANTEEDSRCKASKLSGKRKSRLRLQDLLYTQGGLPPALKGSDRIRSVCGYDRKK